jgi:hypothetical protein
MKSFSKSLEDLGVCLNHKHPSMSLKYNPVLTNLQNDTFSEGELGSVLGQYSLLPAAIVEFLGSGRARLQEWTDVKTELDKNIGEEEGSRTNKQPHYMILKAALLRELHFDVSGVQALPSTTHFLELVRNGLVDQRKEAFVAGVLYGLEASAVPELTVVAKLINEYADAIGKEMPIAVESATGNPLKLEGGSTVKGKYSLDVFFALHLWDFEVGHKAGLETSLAKYLKTSEEIKDFEAGFEYVLAAMDEWWVSLSQSNGMSDRGTSQELAA